MRRGGHWRHKKENRRRTHLSRCHTATGLCGQEGGRVGILTRESADEEAGREGQGRLEADARRRLGESERRGDVGQRGGGAGGGGGGRGALQWLEAQAEGDRAGELAEQRDEAGDREGGEAVAVEPGPVGGDKAGGADIRGQGFGEIPARGDPADEHAVVGLAHVDVQAQVARRGDDHLCVRTAEQGKRGGAKEGEWPQTHAT